MTCTDCHTGITKGVYRASSTTCADCHGDSEYQAVFDDWAAEAEARIDELKAVRIEVEAELLDADRAKRNTAEAWETYQRAITNLKFVRNDGTNSVHNNEYATAILDTVEADFKETLRQLDTIW
jgi:signal transduction protein with GAF and PtsI domain